MAKEWGGGQDTAQRQELVLLVVFPPKPHSRPDWCGSVGWALFCEVKGCQLDSVKAQARVAGSVPSRAVRGNQTMFLSHISVSLLSPTLPFSLKINKLFKKIQKPLFSSPPPPHVHKPLPSTFQDSYLMFLIFFFI